MVMAIHPWRGRTGVDARTIHPIGAAKANGQHKSEMENASPMHIGESAA